MGREGSVENCTSLVQGCNCLLDYIEVNTLFFKVHILVYTHFVITILCHKKVLKLAVGKMWGKKLSKV